MASPPTTSTARPAVPRSLVTVVKALDKPFYDDLDRCAGMLALAGPQGPGAAPQSFLIHSSCCRRTGAQVRAHPALLILVHAQARSQGRAFSVQQLWVWNAGLNGQVVKRSHSNVYVYTLL